MSEAWKATYNRACCDASCENCDIDKMEWRPGDFTTDVVVSYLKTEYSELQGKKSRHFTQRETVAELFLEMFCKCFQEVAAHLFLVEHQAAYHDRMHDIYPDTAVLSRWDYSQNYSHRFAVQCTDQYYDPYQTTILVCVTNYHDVAREQREEGRHIICLNFFLSADLTRNSAFV